MNATPEDARRRCARCGQPLSDANPAAPCPRCALARALSVQQETVVMTAAEPALSAGTPVRYFGDYEILGELARGAMGIVYRARQISLNRTVALKMIQAGRFATPEMVQRFHIEAEAAAQLDHPNIVPVYEVGKHEGYHFLSMRLLEGGTLREKADALARQPREAVRLVEKVARAVHHANQRGVLHRDLKPANILLDNAGEPFVADFGLARLHEAGSGMTHSGTVLGTPSYMSPEQASGHARAISASSDVYGLGAILYHVLCGRPPFTANTPMATLRRVMDEEPAPPRRIHPELDRDIETVVLKCLEKDPARRYGSAALLADDLANWLAHRPVSARPVGPAERVGKWCRRRPAVAALAAALAVAAVALAAGSVLFAFRLGQERNAAVAARERARESQYTALLNQARAERASEREGRRRRALEAIRSAAEIRAPPELRREAVAALGLEDFSEAARWPSECAAPRPSCVFDRSGGLLAFQASGTSVCVRSLPSNRTTATLPAGEPLSFSPDGRWLALRVEEPGRGGWELYRLDDPSKPAFSHPTLSQRAVEFSCDSQQVFFASADGQLYEMPLSDLTPRAMGVRVEGAQRICEMPQGRCLAVSSGREVAMVDTEQDRQLLRLLLPDRVHGLAASPDGAMLACACADRTVHLFCGRPGGVRSQWQLAQRPLKTAMVEVRWHWTLTGHSHDVVQVAFTAGGRYLASHSWDQSTRLWDMADGRCVGISEKELVPGIDASDTRLGFTTPGAFGLWWVEPSPCVAVRCGVGAPAQRFSHLFPGMPPERNNLHHVDLSRDGRRAVTAGPLGCKVWDLAGRAPATEVVTSGCTSAWFVPGPEGERVLFTDAQGFAMADPRQAQAATRFAGGADLRRGALDPSARRAVAVDGDGRLWRWDAARPGTESLRAAHRAGAEVAAGLALRLAAIGTRQGDDVGVWDLGADRHLTNLPVRGSAIVAFAPDGKTLYTGGGSELAAWSATDWRKRWTRDTHGNELPTPVAVHPAGAALAIHDQPNAVTLLDADSGAELEVVDLPLSVNGGWSSFSPDGTKLALAGDDEILQIVDFARLDAELTKLSAESSFHGAFAELCRPVAVPTPAPPPVTRVSEDRKTNNVPPATQGETRTPAFIAVDFGPRANRNLADALGSGMSGNTLAGLAAGRTVLGGVPFEVGPGLLHLGSRRLPALPEKIEGLRLDRACTRLHFLHATVFGNTSRTASQSVEDGTVIGAYRVHFDDQSLAEIPIVYGRDVRDWWTDPQRPDTSDRVVWRSTNGLSRQNGAGIRLYLTTWENPSPDKRIATLDYCGKKDETAAAPFCVAITADSRPGAASPAESAADGATPGATATGIHEDLRDALAEANRAGRLLLVDFYGAWCPWCVKMDQTLADPAIKAAIEKGFLYHKLDVGRFDQHTGCLKQYGVRGIPNLVVFDAKGGILAQKGGYMPPAAFVSFLEGAAKGEAQPASPASRPTSTNRPPTAGGAGAAFFDEGFWSTATPEKVRQAIASGADVHAPCPHCKNPRHTLLLQAVAGGATAEAIAELKRAGLDLDSCDPDGYTALMRVAQAQDGTPEAVKALVGGGADLNFRGNARTTALHLAFYEGEPEVAVALVEAGADPDVRAQGGSTVLIGLARGNHDEAVDWAFPVLLRAGARIDARDNLGCTALIRAVLRGRPEKMIRMLLEAGADTALRTHDENKTALDYARGKPELAGTEALRMLEEATARQLAQPKPVPPAAAEPASIVGRWRQLDPPYIPQANVFGVWNREEITFAADGTFQLREYDPPYGNYPGSYAVTNHNVSLEFRSSEVHPRRGTFDAAAMRLFAAEAGSTCEYVRVSAPATHVRPPGGAEGGVSNQAEKGTAP